MRIKQTIERVPGGLMVVPLLAGTLLNTLDQLHLAPVQAALRWLGATPTAAGHYEFLRIGGFAEALFKTGALTLIALFLFCAASQTNVRVGRRALKKGLLLTLAKYGVGLGAGYLFGLFFDPFHGLLGLSTLAIIAAMTNSNGGLYVALTELHGNRSDIGAIAVLSLNDGPFLTLLGLGLLGAKFPWIVFLAVLIPIGAGMLLGNLDEELRRLFQPGERLVIPFFAFALGCGMSFSTFANTDALAGGVLLGVATVALTGTAGVVVLRLFHERSQIAGVAEASTDGNAVATPAAVAAAATAATALGVMSPEQAERYQQLVGLATAQISISTLTTALLCPLAVIGWSRWQQARGIDGTQETP